MVMAPEPLTGQVSFREVAAAAASVQAPDHILRYGSLPSQFAELRLPAPRQDGGGSPVVVLIHGGCWLDSYGVDHIAPVAEALREAGYAVWAPEYRRVGDEGGGIPGTFEDIRAGWSALEQHASIHNLDRTRVLLMGHSAGGHLALWLAGESGVEARGVISLAGITDLSAYHAPSGCGASVAPLLGGPPDLIPEAYSRHSPSTRPPLGPVTKVTLVVAQDDTIVPESQARAYAHIDPHAQIVEVQGGHFDLIAPWTASWPTLLELVQRQLEP